MNDYNPAYLAQHAGIPQECIATNVPLSSRTWIHHGGTAKVWFNPKNVEQLEKIGRYLYSIHAHFDVIGHTSNTYFADTYNTDYIVDTKEVQSIVWTDSTIICDCGVPLQKLARLCIKKGIKGYDGFYNIPGTVAGGAVDNSGCYGSQMDCVVLSVDILTPQGEILNIRNNALDYKVRNSALKRHEIEGIILRVYLDASKKGDAIQLQKQGEYNQMLRKYQHEGSAHNLGSVFVYTYHYKKNMRNLLVRSISKIMHIVHIDYQKQQLVIKWMLMILYGYTQLDSYISDKNLKCFLWKKKDADKHFNDFIHFFNSFADSPEIEIVIKK